MLYRQPSRLSQESCSERVSLSPTLAPLRSQLSLAAAAAVCTANPQEPRLKKREEKKMGGAGSCLFKCDFLLLYLNRDQEKGNETRD